MKRSYFILIITFFYMIISSVYHIKAAEKNYTIEKSELFEDSIIIKELKPSVDKFSNINKGEIIYDDSFDDTIIDYEKRTKYKKRSVKKKNRTFFFYLKSRDKRWHLKPYIIRNSDNLWKIAKRFGISHKLLINVNNIDKPNRIRPGKKIMIPTKSGFYYRVRRGDSLSKLALKFKVSMKHISSVNNLRGTLIQKGRKLFIPGSRGKVLKNIKNRRVVNNSRYIAKRKNRRKIRKKPRFSWPMRGRITSAFGVRKHPFTGKRKFHCGIDISAKIGKKVRASAPGRVIFSGWKGAYGKTIIIRHKKGYITVYAHNSKLFSKKNRYVKRGQLIAASGNTGNTTGAHLHFEIRKYVTPLNPVRMLK